MGRVYNTHNIPILINRLISLTAQYSYTISLSIVLAQISINSVMILWGTKIIGSFISVPINGFFGKLQNKKTLLILLEEAKAGVFLMIPFCFHSWILFVGVLLIEIISDVFDGNLVALIPKLVTMNGLSRFNAAITAVGSISYFLGPMLAGIFQGQSNTVLFYLYSLVTFLGGLTLFALSPIKIEFHKKKTKHGFNLLADVNSMFQALTSVTGLLGIYLIYILLNNMGTGLDSFEVIFVTKVVGISSAQYAYSLSFLAVVFLIISSILAVIKIKGSYQLWFQIGALLFSSYALILIISRNLATVLLSYTCLAVGSTLMGNMLDNMIQTAINDEQRSQIFIVEDVLTNVLAAVTIFILGLAQNIGIKISFAYIDLILLTFMVCLFLKIMVFKHKKKASKSNADE